MWTSDIVLTRLIEAYQVIEVTTARVAPKRYGSAMPAVSLDASERYTGNRLDEIEKATKERKDKAAVIAAGSISMALEAQRWPLDLIDDEDKRECLVEFATCRAKDGDWSKRVQRRNRRNPEKKPWSKRTTYRWIEQSIQQVADALNNSGVLLRLPADLQVAHEEAETPCDLAKFGIVAWHASDAIPHHTGVTTIPKPRTNQKRRKAAG